MGFSVGHFVLENFYLLNVFFTGFYVASLLIYLGRFDPDNPHTTAFKRLLLGGGFWAFFDLAITHFSQAYPADIAFLLYRLSTFLFLFIIPASWEVLASLMMRVTGRLRALFYAPFVALYLAGLFFPELVSARTFNIAGGWAGPMPPWNWTFKVLGMGFSLVLLIGLAVNASRDSDRAARREKITLFFGGLAMVAWIVSSQVLKDAMGPDFPWLANLSVAPLCAAAFWGMRRYGRVLAPKALHETTVKLIPNGLAHLQGGVIHWANPGLAALLGYDSPDDLLGLDLGRFLGPESSGIKCGDRSAGHEEVILRGRDGRLVPCLINHAPLDPAKPEQGRVAVFSDLRSVRQAESERVRREKIQAAIETAGATCHELNQPLQSILVAAELMRQGMKGDDAQQERINGILGQIDRITGITRRLNRITDYQTRQYLDQSKILDLEKSSGA